MHHVVARAEWNDAAVLQAVRELVLPAVERRGRVRHWILDAVEFLKQGSHSVGVARQPHGRCGKQDNCQLAVALSVAGTHASLPVAYRLSLPPVWAGDPARCRKAGVPEEARSETVASIALGQVRQASADLPRGVVLGGAEFGDHAELRSGVSGLGLLYALGVHPSTQLWPAIAAREPVPARSLALSLPAHAWRKVAWREEGGLAPSSRFAALRGRPARVGADPARNPEEWLLVEWPCGEGEPTEYWLSNLPPGTPLQDLVRTAKARWRTARDLQELRRGAGLEHYEGRGWRGFHHHASLSIAAYGFLVAERCLHPPAQRFNPGRIELPLRPAGFLPRGAGSASRGARIALPKASNPLGA